MTISLRIRDRLQLVIKRQCVACLSEKHYLLNNL